MNVKYPMQGRHHGTSGAVPASITFHLEYSFKSLVHVAWLMGAERVDQFAVDENGMTVDGYRRLEPVSRKSMYIGNAISFAIVAVIVGAIWFYVSGHPVDFAPIARIACSAVIIVSAIYSLVEPQVIYRRYRYRIDDEKVDIRKGVVFITHQMVPIERIHQVDVTEGPVNRMFGLANVHITTAGGTVEIQWLQREVAEDIADKLNSTVVGILKARE